jgi:hypothetical protein
LIAPKGYAPDDVLWGRIPDDELDENPFHTPWQAFPIVRRTRCYAFVSPLPAGDSAPLPKDLPRFELALLGEHGEAPYYGHKVDHPAIRLYTAEKADEERRDEADCARRLALRDMEVDRRLFDLGAKLDFVEVEPGILKARGFEVYPHDGRVEVEPNCRMVHWHRDGECGIRLERHGDGPAIYATSMGCLAAVRWGVVTGRIPIAEDVNSFVRVFEFGPRRNPDDFQPR